MQMDGRDTAHSKTITRSNQKGFKFTISPSEYWNVPQKLTCVSTCVSERKSTYIFLQSNLVRPLPPLGRTPVRYMTHTMLIAGSRVTIPGMDSRQQSGYQVLRLATELVPSTLALLGADAVSPFWAILFYFVLILFGIAQQVCSAVTCTSNIGKWDNWLYSITWHSVSSRSVVTTLCWQTKWCRFSKCLAYEARATETSLWCSCGSVGSAALWLAWNRNPGFCGERPVTLPEPWQAQNCT